MKRIAALLALALGLGTPAATCAGDLRAFDAGSPAAIRAQYAGRAYVLGFWSVSCEPCRRDMAVWKAMRRRHPGVPVLLVSTDGLEARAQIAAFMKRYDPGPVQSWAYADEFEERVRYAVDPAWRGELPRTYFFDAAHRVEAFSGALDAARVEAWMKRQPASAPRRP